VAPPGKAGLGVQLNTVLPALQTGVVVSSANVLSLRNEAEVAVGSMASLKVKTTGAVVETSVASAAGTVETIVGWAKA
jgi:hypothetical protein